MRKYNQQINVYLSVEQRAQLEAIGDMEGLPLSVVIRNLLIKAIREYNEGGDKNNESYKKYY